MGDKVTDYYHVEIPPEKDPPQYSHIERRAQILDILIASRSPKSVSRTRLAERYDVAVSTITRDIDRLGEVLSEIFDEESIILETRGLRDEVVNDLLDEDDWRAKKAALSCHLDWVSFLGYDDVMIDETAEDEEDAGPRTGARGDLGEHRLPEQTREALDRIHQRDKRELEEKGLVVDTGAEQNTDDAGGDQ